MPQGTVDAAPDTELAGGAHGELSTWMAVIQLTQLTLPVVAAWLMKSRSKTKLEVEVEQRAADGTWVKRVVRLDAGASAAPEADVIDQLSGLLKVPPTGDSGTG